MGKKSWPRRLGRLFVIKTRWEAWAVTWAIALGAVERGKHYLAIYPGTLGWVFFTLCCGVVFIAGAKLLDATKAEPTAASFSTVPAKPRRRRRISRNPPKASRRPGAAASRP